MPSSSVSKRTEDALEEVLRAIRKEYDSPFPVLCEADRNKFVEEEGSLREQLKETMESESNSWRGLLSFPSPRAAKGLKEAEELRQRVKEDINAKLRTRLTGKSSPYPNSAFNLLGARTPETVVTSLLNARHSLSEPAVSEVNVNPLAVQNDQDHTSDIREAINTPLETSSESSDRSRDSSSQRRRRSPPPRRMSQSGNPRFLSDTSSDSDSDAPRHSRSVKRPARPPPQSHSQSRTPRLPTNVSFPSPGSLSPTESLTRQAQGRQRLRCSDDYKTNCVDINGSNVDGLTLNNGGTNNSGAVIHRTMMPPQRLPQHVPQL